MGQPERFTAQKHRLFILINELGEGLMVAGDKLCQPGAFCRLSRPEALRCTPVSHRGRGEGFRFWCRTQCHFSFPANTMLMVKDFKQPFTLTVMVAFLQNRRYSFVTGLSFLRYF
jgi:hypothetical protein